MRTFADMIEAIRQQNDGMVTEGELISVLQLHPLQVPALVEYNGLPAAAHRKVKLTDWDESVETAIAKADHEAEKVEAIKKIASTLELVDYLDTECFESDLGVPSYTELLDAIRGFIQRAGTKLGKDALSWEVEQFADLIAPLNKVP